MISINMPFPFRVRYGSGHSVLQTHFLVLSYSLLWFNTLHICSDCLRVLKNLSSLISKYTYDVYFSPHISCYHSLLI